VQPPFVRKSLPQLAPRSESLGQRTIMDRALALEHGVRYVHAVVFAIDVDRVRDARESTDEGELPFAWEVFLTEAQLVRTLDPKDAAVRSMFEDIVASILELPASEEGVLGTQLPFAVWHAVERGVWPSELRSLFRPWKSRPKDLMKELDAFYADEAAQVAALARMCLETEIRPPLAAPTIEALTSLAAP